MGSALANSIAKKTVVIGLGMTGLSCARYLAHQGNEVVVMDTRNEPPGLDALRQELPEITVMLGGLDRNLLCDADMLVVSPGVTLAQPAIVDAIARGVEVVGDIELFARRATAPVIAITGSNGKSTVTTMLYEMAKAAGVDVRIGGNIGTPVLELLGEKEPELYVLELSSFQLETTHTLKAAAATVLNVSQDHLDRYRDMSSYADAKRRIFKNAENMIVNGDDSLVEGWCEKGDRHCFSFGLNAPTHNNEFGVQLNDDVQWLMHGDKPLMPLSELKVVGTHNVANALAAFALGEVVGLPVDKMRQALASFPGLKHRCQWVAESEGVNWYNDSKATNVGAAVAAITGMDSRVVLIAGGEGKGQDFSMLKPAMVKRGRAVVLIGQDATQIKSALGDVVPTQFAANLGEAVQVASQMARSGDVVLLSPACASFDMFSGYEERGEEFVKAVERLLQ